MESKNRFKDRITDNELKELLDSSPSFYVGRWPQRYKAFNLNAKNCAVLKGLLEEMGYKEATGRNSNLVYYHQIVAFFYLVPTPGLEVHHINGNTLDNRPENLTYLTAEEHALVTKYQRRINKINLKHMRRVENKITEKSMINRQGKRIKSWCKFMLAMIIKSVVLTGKWYSQVSNRGFNLMFNLLKFSRYVEKQIRRLNISGQINDNQLCV